MRGVRHKLRCPKCKRDSGRFVRTGATKQGKTSRGWSNTLSAGSSPRYVTLHRVVHVETGCCHAWWSHRYDCLSLPILPSEAAS